MFEKDSRAYYERRAAHATELARQATDEKIAAIHRELALRYAIVSVHGNQARPDVVAQGKHRKFIAPEPVAALSSGSAEPERRRARKHA